MRTGLLAVAGWLVAAVLMVALSWSAIGVVRTAVVPGTLVATGLPAPQETATGGTAPTTAPTPAPTRSGAPPTTPAARSVLVTGNGGTTVVRCAGGTVQFLNVTPRQGWSVHGEDEPGRVRFDGPSGARTEIRVTCTGGDPRSAVEERSGSGGSGGGDDGDGGDDDD